MKLYKKVIFSAITCLLFYNCYKDAPTMHDGMFNLELFIEYENNALINCPVTITTSDYNSSNIFDTTDSMGMIRVENLRFAQYNVRAIKEIEIPSNDEFEIDTVTVVGNALIEPMNKNIFQDTVITEISGASAGLKINEIFYAGSANENHYQSDQFIELYNSSKNIIYLDGMIICKMGYNLKKVREMFQFPGEPHNATCKYPIYPGEYKIVVQDAINHNNVIINSFDFRNADFEFVNSKAYAEPDNQDVPNLDNLINGKYHDFIMGIFCEIILISDGSDLDYTNGIDIESVIDCVNYWSSNTNTSTIEREVERGNAGYGIGAFSGKSIERILPGYDTNNSTVDFQILKRPTPGYQNE